MTLLPLLGDVLVSLGIWAMDHSWEGVEEEEGKETFGVIQRSPAA